MEAVLNFIKTIVNLGAFVMMPIIICILGMCFRMKFKDALRAGIMVGIGFKGISLTAGLISSTMTPLVEQLQQLWGLSLNAVDVGVPVVSAIAFSDGLFVLIMFAVVLLVNVVLLLLKVTKTLNIDIWNFWHYLFIGTLATILTGNMWVGVLFGTIYSVCNLLLADHNQDIICEVCGEQYRGLSFCTMAFPVMLPIVQGVDWVIDHIPGIRNIDINMHKLPGIFSFLGEPSILGLVIGIILAALGQYSWDQCLVVGMSLAAAMVLLPRMISLLVEGLSSVVASVRDFMTEHMPGREFRIGMDFALLVGDPDMISLGLVMVPVSLLLAVVLPGNTVLPVIGLTNLSYMMMAPVIGTKRNMFRAFIAGVIAIIMVFYMATALAPLITEAGVAAGLVEAGGTYSLFNTGELIGFLLLIPLGLFGY